MRGATEIPTRRGSPVGTIRAGELPAGPACPDLGPYTLEQIGRHPDVLSSMGRPHLVRLLLGAIRRIEALEKGRKR